MGVSHPSVLAQIIREGMDDYWRVVYSKTDEGLTAYELKQKRAWEKDTIRLDKKFGPLWESLFKNG